MLLPRLIENLQQQAQRHHQLLVLLRQEADLEVTCTAEELEHLQQQKQELAVRLKTLEESRLSLIQEEEKRTGKTIPNLRTIIDEADHTLGSQLRSCHSDLLSVIHTIGELARQTATQANARLVCFRQTSHNIRTALKQAPYYLNNGSVRHKTSAHFVHKYA